MVPGRKRPGPKPNPNPNIILTLTLTPHGGTSEKNTSGNVHSHSTIFQPFQFEPEQKKNMWN